MFKPGQSGNPAGRAPGTGKVNEYRKLLESRLPELVKVLVDQALEGEPSALKLCFDRLIPSYRPETRPVEFTVPESGNLKEIGNKIISLIGTGEISPEQGNTILTALTGQAKLVEMTDLEQRIKALEEATHSKA